MRTFKAAALALVLFGFGAMMTIPLARAQSNSSKQKLTDFFNKVTKINKNQEALAGQVVMNAGNNLPLKTYAQTVKWNDVVNEQGVEALAAKKNININGNVKVPTANSNLLHMTGNQFAKAYIGTELKDQSKALQDYQKAEQEFKNDPHVEMYIEQSIPIVQTHLQEAKLLQQHENQIMAQE
jgi:predicted outer membrane protein